MSLEMFSFDDMFKPSAPTEVERKAFIQDGHSEDGHGFAVIEFPPVHEMNRDELLDLIQTHTATIFMQGVLLDALGDVLIKTGVINPNDLQKRFEELIHRQTLRKED